MRMFCSLTARDAASTRALAARKVRWYTNSRRAERSSGVLTTTPMT
jgi:hypothetical protein